MVTPLTSADQPRFPLFDSSTTASFVPSLSVNEVTNESCNDGTIVGLKDNGACHMTTTLSSDESPMTASIVFDKKANDKLDNIMLLRYFMHF